MRLVVTLAYALALAACGPAPIRDIATNVRLAAALSERVAALDVYILAPRMTDGIYLVCTIMDPADNSRVAPDDPKVEVLGHRNVTFDGSNSAIKLEEIPAGSALIVYVAALDSSNELIGWGCEDEDVTVQSDTTTTVNVTVYEYTGS